MVFPFCWRTLVQTASLNWKFQGQTWKPEMTQKEIPSFLLIEKHLIRLLPAPGQMLQWQTYSICLSSAISDTFPVTFKVRWHRRSDDTQDEVSFFCLWLIEKQVCFVGIKKEIKIIKELLDDLFWLFLNPSVNPFSCLSNSRLRGSWSLFQLHRGRWGPPWTGDLFFIINEKN